MSIADLISTIGDAGVLGLLIIIIYGGRKGWYVWGEQYREAIVRLTEMKDEKDEWQNRCLKMLETVQAGVNTVEKAVAVAKTLR